ncbi:MAG: hypothetical protein EBX41_05155 [Chitinophagia bacterium]|nr:hypothetical protein [Chitinophagia bacterium]
MRKLIFLLFLSLFYYPAIHAQNGKQTTKMLETANVILNGIYEADDIKQFVKQKQEISEKLTNLNAKVAQGTVTVQQYNDVKSAYNEMSGNIDRLIEQLNKDIGSYNSLKQLSNSSNTFSLINQAYKQYFDNANQIYTNKFLPAYDRAMNAPRDKAIALIPLLIEFAPKVINIINSAISHRLDIKQTLFDLAAQKIQSGIREKLQFPEWSSIVTNMPPGSSTAGNNNTNTNTGGGGLAGRRNGMNGNTNTNTQYRVVDAQVQFVNKDNAAIPFTVNQNTGNPFFVSANNYGEGTKYAVAVKGYAYAAAVAYSTSKRKWDKLVLYNNSTAVALLQLPQPIAGKQQYFTIRGTGIPNEQFLILLSNQPINEQLLNQLCMSTTQGSGITNDAFRIFGSDKTANPMLSNTAGALQSISINNVAINQLIIPMYFQINRQ